MYDRFCLALAAAREIDWGINGLDNLPNHLGKRRVGREIAQSRSYSKSVWKQLCNYMTL